MRIEGQQASGSRNSIETNTTVPQTPLQSENQPNLVQNPVNLAATDSPVNGTQSTSTDLIVVLPSQPPPTPIEIDEPEAAPLNEDVEIKDADSIVVDSTTISNITSAAAAVLPGVPPLLPVPKLPSSSWSETAELESSSNSLPERFSPITERITPAPSGREELASNSSAAGGEPKFEIASNSSDDQIDQATEEELLREPTNSAEASLEPRGTRSQRNKARYALFTEEERKLIAKNKKLRCKRYKQSKRQQAAVAGLSRTVIKKLNARKRESSANNSTVESTVKARLSRIRNSTADQTDSAAASAQPIITQQHLANSIAGALNQPSTRGVQSNASASGAASASSGPPASSGEKKRKRRRRKRANINSV